MCVCGRKEVVGAIKIHKLPPPPPLSSSHYTVSIAASIEAHNNGLRAGPFGS